MFNASVAVYRNVFALIVDIDDYEGETRLQTKRAAYAEIRAWVKQNYGLHVSNLAISWTKDREIVPVKRTCEVLFWFLAS